MFCQSFRYIVWFVLAVAKGDKLVRMDLTIRRTHSSQTCSDLVVKLTIDGQVLFSVVDTGASLLSLVWKQWFEMSRGVCEDLFFGCYQCVSPCKQGQITNFAFDDDSVVSVFPHSGVFDLSDGTSARLDFGLVAGFNRNISLVWSSFGLAISEDENYKSIVQQLSDKDIIDDNSFSIYLNTADSNSGEVILGGEDPTKRAGPLKFFKIVNITEESARLRGLILGGDPRYSIDITDNVAFDTGADAIFMNKKRQRQVISFLKVAGKKKIDIQARGKAFFFPCKDADNLPSMTFYVEGLWGEKVPLEITPEALVLRFRGDDCLLRIEFTDFDRVFLGQSAFLGNYFYFDMERNRIGFTKAKQ
ncbi:hypothetical protein FOL47_000530 [Perkinsus chesapeaki]|uniref:Peptidase A1 domain-containing protein n=1 Tax=Perkinsus chesapeaki TaxID=330153 RepID=A0A7J6KWI3_PERCH|nr:hypothetical protein FOL47_000530 [Perkinsus chesapeaki]